MPQSDQHESDGAEDYFPSSPDGNHLGEQSYHNQKRPSFAYNDERLNRAEPPASPFGFGRFNTGAETHSSQNAELTHRVLGDAITDTITSNKTSMSTTKNLAQEHGIRNPRLM